MTVSEFKHLNRVQLRRRCRILYILVYIFAAMGLGSFVMFIIAQYKFDWSWLLIGVTYLLLAVQYGMQMRRLRSELKRREERLTGYQEAI